MTRLPDTPAEKPSWISAFLDLARLPFAFWILIAAFVVESMAYFGVLTLMTEYFTADLGWSDAAAAPLVSVFTMLVTLFMLGAGSYAESFGLRRAVIASLVICVVGRYLYADLPGPSMLIVSLLVIALGEAILQPVCYSGVKQYTDERTSSMGYGLIYAIMNGGIVIVGGLSAYARPGVQRVVDHNTAVATQPALVADDTTQSAIRDPILGWLAGVSGSGVQAVNWLCFGLSAVTLLLAVLFFTRRVEAAKIRPDRVEELRKSDRRPLLQKLLAYFQEGPFRDKRFLFFIFMLLPVRTLFAHQWLTMPQYILRAYPDGVADRMEWLVNWTNPAIILVGVPIATALTRKVNIYTMMVIGSLVSAAPTFLLCCGPNLSLLITYLVLFSVGEALWSARFLEYASELAPQGRIAQYMGLANVPWLLAKGTTGFYSGALLARFCPPDTPVEQLNTGALWFIYGCIAMLSPIGLLLARKWVMAGMTSPAPQKLSVH